MQASETFTDMNTHVIWLMRGLLACDPEYNRTLVSYQELTE